MSAGPFNKEIALSSRAGIDTSAQFAIDRLMQPPLAGSKAREAKLRNRNRMTTAETGETRQFLLVLDIDALGYLIIPQTGRTEGNCNT